MQLFNKKEKVEEKKEEVKETQKEVWRVEQVVIKNDVNTDGSQSIKTIQVVTNGEKQLDLHSAIAEVLNGFEYLKSFINQ